MKSVYIYSLIEPDTYRVRYVGKSTNLKRRIIQHISESKSGYHQRRVSNWIRGLLLKGLRPVIEELEVCNSTNWEDRERYWIKYYRNLYPDLCNHAEGGIGCSGKNSKETLSSNQRRVLSDRARKLFGKYTDEERLSMWCIIQNNPLKSAMVIDSRITRHIHSDVRRGVIWNDITGLSKPPYKGISIGENHPSTKINMDIVNEIRQTYKKKEVTLRILSLKYNISIPQVAKIVNNTRWKDNIPARS